MSKYCFIDEFYCFKEKQCVLFTVKDATGYRLFLRTTYVVVLNKLHTRRFAALFLALYLNVEINTIVVVYYHLLKFEPI